MASLENHASSQTSVGEPFDLVKLSLDEIVIVKLRAGRTLKGRLHVSDSKPCLGERRPKCWVSDFE